VQELRTIRRQLSTQLNQIGAAATAAERQQFARQMQELVTREADLSRKLGFAGARDRARWNWIELADVRQALAADSMLIDVVRVKLQDYDAPVGVDGLPAPPHFLAWLVPPAGAGDVRVFDLGPADQIESLAANLLAELEQVAHADDGTREKLAQLATTYREASAKLAQRILHPLLAHAGKAQHWIISPDADLWLVPWNALLLDDGAYFSERFRLTHVVSARDVLPRPAAAGQAPGPPLIVADPNYDRGVLQPQLRQRSVAALPNTAEEARLAAPLLEQICGAPADVRLKDQASKSVVLAAHSPQVLMLGTHGTFLALPAGERTAGLGSPLENPLLRCQLLFAGCNAPSNPNQDNGVLLGMEVLDCDLRATDLVVLSACETARGDVHSGQTAAGMRQAFQLAGAHDVIATLWPVDDAAATRLTSGFLRQLAAGREKADALRLAQLELIAELKQTPGVAHPFYWAPYMLTGCEPCALKKKP
jgi:CHAT domain-containing protein